MVNEPVKRNYLRLARQASNACRDRGIGRVEAEDRLPLAHFLGHEGLEQVLFRSVMGDLLGDVGRDHHHALAVADHDVAREYRHAAAADRHVQVDRMMLDQVGRRRAALAIGREGELRDLGRIPQAPVADHAGGAADHHARHQDAAGRRDARVAAAVHHQHAAGRNVLDGLALRVGAVGEHVERVDVLARRNVAQRVGRSDHRRRRSGLSGRAPCTKVLRRPRLNSCVVSVAVLTVRSFARAASLSGLVMRVSPAVFCRPARLTFWRRL